MCNKCVQDNIDIAIKHGYKINAPLLKKTLANLKKLTRTEIMIMFMNAPSYIITDVMHDLNYILQQRAAEESDGEMTH